MTDNDIDAIRQQVERYTGFAGSSQQFLAHKLAKQVPDLLAKVDELTAEREHMELNPTGTAEWLKNRVSELAADLTQSRAQAATYANEIGRLTAENARVRQQRDEATAEPVCPACDKPGRHPETCPTVPAELPAEATR